MKSFLFLIVSGLLFGCAVKREFMANVTDATLIKIDVVNRYPDRKLKMLTWRTIDQVDYITYESINSNVAVGDVMKVLIKR